MPVARVKVTIPRASGIPADAVVNTFHFVNGEVGALSSGAATTILGQVDQFYQHIDSNLSQLLGTGISAEVYDVGDPEPRVPVLSQALTPLNLSAAVFPAEVALCLSWQANPVSGVPQGRRRGRVFLGPLAGTGITTVASGDMRPSATLMDTILDGAVLYLSEFAVGVDTFRLATYSETQHQELGGGGDPELATYPADQMWIDNAFDIQRRRGAEATTRDLRVL